MKLSLQLASGLEGTELHCPANLPSKMVTEGRKISTSTLRSRLSGDPNKRGGGGWKIPKDEISERVIISEGSEVWATCATTSTNTKGP